MPNPLSDGVNVRSKGYLIARTAGVCAHCGLKTRLVALVLPVSHEALSLAEDEQDGTETDSWDTVPCSAFLFKLGYLPDDVQRRMGGFSKTYRPAMSAAAQGSYWANHCEHCGSLLDDHELFCEPDGAFLPTDESNASIIHLVPIDEALEAVAAGYAYEPYFFGS